MNIQSWYKDNFETRLKGRYITLEHLFPLLESYKDLIEISSVGTSELGNDILLLKIGQGKKVVFGWSQMHGNESTTTKALFDFLKFILQKENFQKEIISFLDTYTFYFIPILNPDGASAYTRANANEVDLNRDAQNLSQTESQTLREVFELIKPNLCLNLHDQRSIYGLSTAKPATISFLAPAANKRRTITKSRKIAMQHIVRMHAMLEAMIPGQIGRYNDTFNSDCVGDTFQQLKIPTILFEAGHFPGDYQREKTRELIFYAFLELFQILENRDAIANYKEYFDIPENRDNYRDVILKNVQIPLNKKLLDISIQFTEELHDKEIQFIPTIDSVGDTNDLSAHEIIDLKGATLLVNSQEKIRVGQIVSTIVNKEDNSVIILQRK